MPLVRVERSTSSPAGYQDALTGMRGVAALWVYLFHAWGEAEPRLMTMTLGGHTLDLTPLFSTGWLGAELFYVLSGFLLALPFAHAGLAGSLRPDLRAYARRRLLRVLPAYYAQIALLVLLGAFGWWAMPSVASVVAHLLMLHNLWPPIMQQINPVYLTLPIEFEFYVLLPLLALVPPRRWLRLYLVVLTCVVTYRLAVFHLLSDTAWWKAYPVLILEQLPGTLDRFVAGMVAACALLALRREALQPWRDRLRVWLFPVAVAAVLALIYYQHRNYEQYWQGGWTLFLWRSVTGVALAAAILGTALGNPLARGLLANRAVFAVGVVSYSLYLWHVPVMLLLSRAGAFALFEGYRLVPIVLLSLPASLAVAAVSYRWTEYPFLRRSHARAAPRDDAAAWALATTAREPRPR